VEIGKVKRGEQYWKFQACWQRVRQPQIPHYVRDDNRDTSVVLMVGALMLGEKRRQDAGATMRLQPC
jgi:hypothetical protein